MNLGYWGKWIVEVEKDTDYIYINKYEYIYICIYIYIITNIVVMILYCFLLWMKFPGTIESTVYMWITLGEDKQLRMLFEIIQFKKRK